jgi:LDH2 family malate/lactate/ureidoglycolate dehydrogenase
MRVALQRLSEISQAVLTALGAGPDEASLVAKSLVRAEARGIATHGVNFLEKIAQRIEHGALRVPTGVTVVSREGATCHLDGGNGLGQVAADQAMRMSIDAARAYGVGVALVRNTNHIGVLATYTEQAAREGMVGICMCNAAPSMAPTGGAEPVVGTNPISLAVPGGGDAPILFDMSTSIVARGKIRRALALGQEIPHGWALDREGNPTTDPKEAMRGVLLPVGGPKGYALALFIDLLAGLLSGSNYGRKVLTFHEPLGPTGVGVMTMAVDIGRFMPVDRFRHLVSEYADELRQTRKAPGVERIYLPGEIEVGLEEQSRHQGIELDASTMKSLNGLLVKYKLPLDPLEA